MAVYIFSYCIRKSWNMQSTCCRWSTQSFPIFKGGGGYFALSEYLQQRKFHIFHMNFHILGSHGKQHWWSYIFVPDTGSESMNLCRRNMGVEQCCQGSGYCKVPLLLILLFQRTDNRWTMWSRSHLQYYWNAGNIHLWHLHPALLFSSFLKKRIGLRHNIIGQLTM